MRQLFQLGRKRSLFRASLLAASFGLLFALVTFSLAKTPPRYAKQSPVRETAITLRTSSAAAQEASVTEVPPFVGTHSETWEEFPVEKFGSSEVSILDGTAVISGTRLETATSHMFQLCGFYAQPTDGKIFFGADSTNAFMTVSFSRPVTSFGAYWGNMPEHPEGCGGTDTTFSFKDAEGNLVGEASYPAGNGAMHWHGYILTTPVKTVEIGGVFLVTDGMQATVSTVNSLSNISTRGLVQTGDNALVGGIIVTGTQPKKIIVRAIGSSLSLADKLADPILELHDSSGALLETNDNWMDSPNKQAIIDSTIPPSNSLESAIVRTVAPDAYTAIVRGVNNGTGLGVVEVYDLDTSADSKLANIATRGLVQTGDNVLIAGMIVAGQASQKVIIRALGPSLSVPGKLADPTLELHDSNGALLEASDNWVDNPNKQAIIDSTIPPTNNLESAIVRMLAPANYTAIVRGAGNTTGIAVVEVYALN